MGAASSTDQQAPAQTAHEDPVLATEAFVKEQMERAEREKQAEAEAAFEESRRIKAGKERAQELQKRLGLLQTPERCLAEEREALACVKQNPGDGLACVSLVQRFEKCASGRV
jgi:hypothetical protein